jgi:hypothetical protein
LGGLQAHIEMQDGKLIERALSYIRVIAKRDDRTFSLAIRMGDFELADYKLGLIQLIKNFMRANL